MIDDSPDGENDDLVVPTPEEIDQGTAGHKRRPIGSTGSGGTAGKIGRAVGRLRLRPTTPGIGRRRTEPPTPLPSPGDDRGPGGSSGSHVTRSEGVGAAELPGSTIASAEADSGDRSADGVPSWVFDEEPPTASGMGEAGEQSWTFDEEPALGDLEPSPPSTEEPEGAGDPAVKPSAQPLPAGSQAASGHASEAPTATRTPSAPNRLRRIAVDRRTPPATPEPRVARAVALNGVAAVKAKAEAKGHHLSAFTEPLGSRNRLEATCGSCGRWAAVVYETPEYYGSDATHEVHVGPALEFDCA